MPPRRRKAAASSGGDLGEDGGGAGGSPRAAAAASSPPPPPLTRAASTRTPRPSPPAPLHSEAAASASGSARFRSFRVRTASTVAMIVGFFAVVWAGHVPCALLVLTLQFLMVRELFALARAAAREDRALPGFRLQQWYFFLVAAFYLYGRFVHNNLLFELALPELPEDDHEDEGASAAAAASGGGPLATAAAAAAAQAAAAATPAAQRHASATRGSLPLTALLPARWRPTAAALGAAALRHHAMSAFALYMAGFVAFVLSLRRGQYAYQFQQFAWTHMIMLVVFFPSSFFVSNIFEGLVWFLLPSSLIIVNDIAAYLAGFFCGRTPLIALSPKKTWEGFIGGFFGTVVAAFFLARAFSRFKWMTCPRLDLSLGPLDCDPGPLFEPRDFTPAELAAWLRVPPAFSRLARRALSLALSSESRADELAHGVAVTLEPIQLHAVILAVFASAVAPFGGFFASGFKRAFKMKDFGDTIPGHGGVTDRFDCQTIMAAFAYLYYWHCVDGGAAGRLGKALTQAQALKGRDRLELFGRLGALLVAEGLLPEEPGLGVARLALRLSNATVAQGAAGAGAVVVGR